MKNNVDRKKVYQFYLQEMKNYLKNKKAIMFKFDPLILYAKHDKEGQTIGNETEQNFVDFLEKQGAKHRGFTIGYTDEAQFRWSYALTFKIKHLLI